MWHRMFEALLQGGLCKGFTGAVAHEALPLYRTWRWDGDGTTEWQLRAETATYVAACGTSRITPHFT
jgi:hypothetical protein